MTCHECLHHDVCFSASIYSNADDCKQCIPRTMLTNLQRDLALVMKERTELKRELEYAKDCICDVEDYLYNNQSVFARERIYEYYRRNADD